MKNIKKQWMIWGVILPCMFYAQNRKLEWESSNNPYIYYFVCDSTSELVLVNLNTGNISSAGVQNVRYIHFGALTLMHLKKDSTVWTKGYNYYGALGDSTNVSNNNNWVKVKKIDKIVEISSGISVCGALKSDGSVWVWGYKAKSFSGNGTGSSNYPLKINGLSNVKHISISDEMIFVIKEDSTVWRIDTMGNIKKINGLSQIVQIEVINNFGVVAAKDIQGNVWVYGIYRSGAAYSSTGNYGIGYYGNGRVHYSDTLVHKVPIKNVKDIRTEGFSFVAIKNNGTLWRWGGTGAFDSDCYYYKNVYNDFYYQGGYYYPFIPTLHFVINADSLIREFSGKVILKNDGSVWKEKCADKALTGDTTHFIAMYELLAAHPCSVVGIKEWAYGLPKRINISPNPASSSINIQTTNNSRIQAILLKDLTGKVLLQQNFPSASTTASIDVSTLSNGLYLLEIHTSSSVVTEKLVVQK